MNRGLLMLLLALDLFVMGFSAYILFDRVRKYTSPAPQILAPLPAPAAAPASTQAAAAPEEEATVAAPAPAAPQKKIAAKKVPAKKAATAAHKAAAGSRRKILFRYRDAVPKRVAIVGSFNRWSPQLMQKDAGHNWTIQLELSPGEYAYNFVVDGRMIRDPSNRKSKNAGQKIPSSLIVVKSK